MGAGSQGIPEAGQVCAFSPPDTVSVKGAELGNLPSPRGTLIVFQDENDGDKAAD